ncbi:MAG: kelch repeat-containing protein [Ginsengibacter sp.]
MPKFLWTQKQDMGPAARTGHSMVFDAGREQVILFGGASATKLFTDTWEWDGNFWTQMADMGVGPRKDFGMAYDPVKQQTILFGGTTTGINKFGDTWAWNGSDWTQLSNSGPAARRGHSLVYNSSSQKIFLFGGQGDPDVLNDSWEFDGAEWTQVEDTGPAAREFHLMAYDTLRKRVVLFGGTDGVKAFGDTWEWDGKLWTQVGEFGPDPLLGGAMTFTNSHALLFGGIDSNDPVAQEHRLFNNSWEWDGKHWTQRQDIGPGSRYGHAMAFDTKRSTVVLFGGQSAFANDPADIKALPDTWEHLDETPPPAPDQLTIISLSLNPQPVTADQVAAVVVTAVISGPAPAGGLTLPLGFAPPGGGDSPDLSQLKILANKITIAAGETSGSSPIGANTITVSAFIVSVIEPNAVSFAFLTVS